jgi:hypothetical protein
VVPSLRTESPLTDLDGLTVWHETRLEEEDIENVPNMATTDIVELLLNTRMPPNRLIDWVDQAILYTHLTPSGAGKAKGSGQADADRRRGLRRLGIRTATSFVELPVRDPETAEILQAEQIEPSSLLFLQEAVKTDANFALVRRWRCLSASAPAASRAGGTVRAVVGNAGPGTEPIVAVPTTPA